MDNSDGVHWVSGVMEGQISNVEHQKGEFSALVLSMAREHGDIHAWGLGSLRLINMYFGYEGASSPGRET